MFAVASSSYGWLGHGHEQVADIAWLKLSSASKAALGKILAAQDKTFEPSELTDSNMRAAFRKASTFADYIKDHKDTSYEPEVLAWNQVFQPGYDPEDKDREAHRCKRWHYFDVPIRFQGSTPGVEGSNALIAMTTARYEFGERVRQGLGDTHGLYWWLMWMEHIIGDLHQPLHCVSSYEFEAKGDAGGNLFRLGVSYPDNPNRKMNLHFYWDQGIENAIASEAGQPSDYESVSERWLKAYPPSQEKMDDQFMVSHWISDSARLAQDVVYSGIERDGTPTPEYAQRQIDVCRKQAVLAGCRLANELNNFFKNDSQKSTWNDIEIDLGIIH